MNSVHRNIYIYYVYATPVMVQRIALAMFNFVRNYSNVLHDRLYYKAVTDALVYRILHKVDWLVISKLDLVDNLLTLLRQQPSSLRSLIVPVFDDAFHIAYSYRSLFSFCVDRAIGPSVLSELESCPVISDGPVEDTVDEV